MDAYAWAKALHLVSVISLFAGLFYSVRLFIYHVEALEKPEHERAVLIPQYTLMERRLWLAIVNPALIGTTVFGLWLMWQIHAWTQPWFHVKLALLFLLFGYHGICSRIRRSQSRCEGLQCRNGSRCCSDETSSGDSDRVGCIGRKTADCKSAAGICFISIANSNTICHDCVLCWISYERDCTDI